MRAELINEENYRPPAWLAKNGYSKLQLMWLCERYFERNERLQIENRQLRARLEGQEAQQ
ncbi:hypothetical protein [Sinomonas soli]